MVRVEVKEEKREKIGRWRKWRRDGLLGIGVLGFRGIDKWVEKSLGR